MILSASQDTICAVATAAGPGAISVIRVSGPDALRITNDVFSGKDLEAQDSHTIHFGVIKDGSALIDEVLVSIFKGPNSYTGEHVTEISCHGSPYIRQQIMNLLIQKGCRAAQAGEFTMRAFLNKKLDLSQAEAVADLIASDSAASHQLAMTQMRGGFSGEISKLRAELINFASLMELELDFGEEDVEFADRDDLKELLFKVHKLTQGLIDSFKVGNVMKNGVPVVIAGKPNAGKSTLLNQVLREERAIVSDIEGTTRDVIEDEVIIDGISFRFVDTAGIRETQDTVEAIGVRKTHEKIKAAAIVIYLFDVNQFTPALLTEIHDQLKADKANTQTRILLVGNKIDGHDLNTLQQEYADFENTLFISAKHNTAVDNLNNKLVELVNLNAVSNQDVIVSNSRHLEALTRANESIISASEGLNTGITGDFIAMDIRQALHYLGEITGEITNDDLLGNIFANFCIGK